MFFFLGIFLLVGGLALLFQGGFSMPNGRTVATKPARRLGGAFVSYLPVLMVLGMLFKLIFDEDVVNLNIVFAMLTLLYLIASLVIFLRAVAPPPRKQSIQPVKTAANRFADPGQGQPTDEANPFDFR